MTTPGSLRLYSTAELIALPPPKWLITPLVPEGGLVALYGPPGACKSFVAVDMAMAVATGRDWHGGSVEPGLVLYVSGEGGTGIGKRARVWCEHYAVHPKRVNMAWLTEPIIIQPNSSQIDRLFDRLQHEIQEHPTLVVIDTLARCFEGDENQQEDMGRFVAGVDRLRHELKTTVLIIHHTRLDGDRERGNTAFRGAADAMITVARPKKHGPIIKVGVDKQKDMEEDGQRTFQLHPIPHSDPLQASCVIVDAVGTGRTAELLSALEVSGVSRDTWYSAGEMEQLSGLARATFFRSMKEAINMGLILKKEGKVRIA